MFPLGAPFYGVQTAFLLGQCCPVVSAVLFRQALRTSRYYRRRHAQAGSRDGDGAGVVVVHAPEGGMRVVTHRALYAPGGLLIGQSRRQMQRHVDPGRDARRGDELAVLDPPLADVLGPKLLQDLVVGPVRGCLPTFKQPEGGHTTTRDDYGKGIGPLLEPLFGDEGHWRVGVHGLRAFPDGDRPVAGAPVENGFGDDEIEQSQPRVGDDGYGLILLLISWHIYLTPLCARARTDRLRPSFHSVSYPQAKDLIRLWRRGPPRTRARIACKPRHTPCSAP